MANRTGWYSFTKGHMLHFIVEGEDLAGCKKYSHSENTPRSWGDVLDPTTGFMGKEKPVGYHNHGCKACERKLNK